MQWLHDAVSAVIIALAWPSAVYVLLSNPAMLLLVVLGFATGALDNGMALFLIVVSYGYGTLVTLAAVIVEESSFHRYERWRDLGATLWAVIAESLGYRQLTAVWRLQGWWAGLRGTRQVWGEMTRTGFAGATDASGRPGEAEGRG